MGGVVAVVAAAPLLASKALALPEANAQYHQFRPLYLPIYQTLQVVLMQGMPFMGGLPGKVLHDRAALPGEDPSTFIIDIFETKCLEAFRNSRAATLTLSTGVLDQVLPRRDGQPLARRGRIFCVPNAKDGPQIFKAMRGVYSVFDDQGIYAARSPYACGAPYMDSGKPYQHPGLQAVLTEDNRPVVTPAPMSHCWASGQAGDYDVVLKGIEASLKRYGRPYARNANVADGDWLRQTAYEITYDTGVVTVLLSGPLQPGMAGPKVEVNVLPVRFIP